MTLPTHDPDSSLYNRLKTNGVHGIWGHNIGDLYLEGAEETSPGYFTLSVGS